MSIFKVDVTADRHHPRVVGPDDAPVPAINEFLSHLEQCTRSPYTIRAYARGLAHFVGWLHEAGVDLDAVTRPVVGQYIGAFGRGSIRRASTTKAVDPHVRNARLVERPPVNEGRQARTVNHRLSVLASYFAFRIRQDDERGLGVWCRRSNPVSTPDEGMASHRLTGRDQPVRERRREFRRRAPRRLPARLDPLLIERLIAAAVSWRDKAILTLLCRTGQRIGDWSDVNGRHGLLGMALSDVDERQQTITVRLKGARQEHRVPVTDDFWLLFRRYLQTERRTPARTAAAWVAQRRGHGVPLSYGAFESALRALGRKVGATVRAHQFRHTFAQGVMETTGNLKVTQALLGHAHLSTTADLYLTVDPRLLVEAVAAVRARTDAAQAQPQRSAEVSRERYAFAYDEVTIEELERAVTAMRSPAGEGR
jgi:site-specific recombinase XerD